MAPFSLLCRTTVTWLFMCAFIAKRILRKESLVYYDVLKVVARSHFVHQYKAKVLFKTSVCI
jgi:hypothetical protein